MSTPYTRAEYRAAEARREMRAIAETADILRQVASHDGHVDAYRGYVSVSLAALVEAVGRQYREMPAEVAACVMAVVHAVDRATGQRRSPPGAN
jgi:hypothetical protein